MRRGTWILAISGMMAFHQSGYAADPGDAQTSGRIDIETPRKSTASDRSTKKNVAAADAPPKNYYKDLFGDDEPAPSPIAKKYIPSSAPTDASPADWSDDSFGDSPTSSSKSSSKKNAIKIDEGPSTERLTTSKSPKGTADKQKPNPKVVQAVYDKPAGKKTPVQQIRAEGSCRAVASTPDASHLTKSIESNARTSVACCEGTNRTSRNRSRRS